VTTLTTRAFDLPEHRAAKADPALIARDEQHFVAIAESLDETIADLSHRLADERRSPGGAGQEAMDRDLEIHRLTARLRALRRFSLDLCLGRIVPDDGSEPVYIGRLGLTDRAVDCAHRSRRGSDERGVRHALLGGRHRDLGRHDARLLLRDIGGGRRRCRGGVRSGRRPPPRRRPRAGGTHTPLPLPGRNLVVVADEANAEKCAKGLFQIFVVDVRSPENPVTISTLPQPRDRDYCAAPGTFGPHNLHENRPGSFQSSRLIFATYYNAGVRAYDIENQYQPREVGYYVPPNPTRMMDPRPNRPQVIQSCDCYVDRNGLMYLTDPNAGLYILQFEGI